MMDSSEFRQVMGNFATGVTVVTLPGDPPHGITVNAFASVSLDPPIVLICIDHDTQAYEALEGEADGYAVNILTEDQQDLGEHFADIEELDSPFETRDTRTEVSGAPIFENSLAYVDCTIHSSHEAGDHTVYFGEVGEGGVLNEDADPVTFFRGDWGGIDI